MTGRGVLSSRGSQSCCWGSRTHKHNISAFKILSTHGHYLPRPRDFFFLFLSSLAVRAFAFSVSGCFLYRTC